MSTPVTCPKCGPREPADLDAVPFRKGYVSLLKDWRTWAVAVGATAVSGMIAGGLGVGSGAVGAGGGAVIGFYMMNRIGTLRQCRQCGSVVRA